MPDVNVHYESKINRKLIPEVQGAYKSVDVIPEENELRKAAKITLLELQRNMRDRNYQKFNQRCVETD